MNTKRIGLITVVVAAITLAFAAPLWLGFALSDLPLAVRTATALGAKLGCSGHFISGFNLEQVKQDVESYSPVTSLLKFEVEEGKRMRASLLGSSASATYRPGLGCTPDIDDTTALDAVRVVEVPEDEALPVNIDTNLQSLTDLLLEQDSKEGLDTRVLLVAHRGFVVAESYRDGVAPSTPLLGWSMGKSVTAMLIGRLETLGRPLPQFGPLFTDWSKDERATIGLDDLLTMTSGLNWKENYVVGSDSTRMLFLDAAAKIRPLASPAAHPPGSYHYYSSGTTNLLMALIHQHLGGTQGTYAFFDEELRRPLGLSGTTFEPDASGVPVGSSYLYATGRDWARLGQLMLNRGEWQGQTLLSPEWIDRATTPNKSANDPRYGYQFWLNQGGEELRWEGIPMDAYAMTGNRGQTVMVIPSAKLVIVRLGWNAGAYPLESRFASLIGEIQATVAD